MIAANNGWLLALDNLSYLPPWLSDCLCRLATGGGFATRELYSDSDEILFDSQRPIILTSIEDVADRGDLLDRAVIVRLPAIPEEKRRRESEFWAVADAARPAILGASLDVAAGLRNLPHVVLDRLPRMADFAAWVTACEPALAGRPARSWPPTAETDPMRTNWLWKLLPSGRRCAGWSRPAAPGRDGRGPTRRTGPTRRPGRGPSAAAGRLAEAGENALTGRLRRLAPNMRRVGVAVAFHRTAGKRLIRLATGGRGSSSSSSPSSPTPGKQVNPAPAGADAVPVRVDPGGRENRVNQALVTMGADGDDVSASFAADDSELISAPSNCLSSWTDRGSPSPSRGRYSHLTREPADGKLRDRVSPATGQGRAAGAADHAGGAGRCDAPGPAS